MKINDNVDKNSEKYRVYLMKKYAVIKIIVFSVLLCFGGIISFIIPLRPKVSESEKRQLTSFPDYDTASFMNGEYFNQIDTWYADTFPFRDNLIFCNEKLESLYGIRTNVMHGVLVKGDDIPNVDIDSDELKNSNQTGSTQKKDSGDEQDKKDGENSQNKLYYNPEDIGTDVDSCDGSTDAKKGEKFNSIFIVNNSAYNIYAFSQAAADGYVQTVNNLADNLPQDVDIYDMIVPTSIDITLDDATRNSLTSSNQKKAMLYMYSKMNDNVKKTYVYDTLKSHRNEYIYFRTDHHWTALGAYYAYSDFISSLGKTPYRLGMYEKKEFKDFKGSLYTQSGVASLANNPDTIDAYVPLSTNSLKLLNRDNEWVDYSIVTDVSGWSSTSKYSTFIGGDNPYVEINNPQIKDGSSCLVIKESFGNALVPFLTDHFQNLYVVDYRYYDGHITELVKEKGIKTVLFVNNITATSTMQRIVEMQNVCQ